MTHDIMVLSRIDTAEKMLSILTQRDKTQHNNTEQKLPLDRMKLSRMTLDRKAFGTMTDRMTLSRMTLSRKTPSRMSLGSVTISIMKLLYLNHCLVACPSVKWRHIVILNVVLPLLRRIFKTFQEL